MSATRIKKGTPKNLSAKRRLRFQMTPSENKLWSKLRGRQLGIKFRRQHGVGPYIVDFYCPEKKLVIEVDGDVHAFEEQAAKDYKREEYLTSLGLKMIRYKNNEILENIEGVLEDLMKVANETDELPPLTPPYKGGELSEKPSGRSEN